jgi:hypothetical protein
MIDNKILELKKGTLQINFELLTRDFFKDLRIITYLVGEQLDKSIPFNLKRFDITNFNETTILIKSKGHNYIIALNNIYTYDNKMGVEYTFYVNKNTD